MKIEIVPATFEHIDLLIAKHREREVEMYRGYDPRYYIQQAIQNSAEAWAGFIDGDLVCLWGVDRGTLISNSAHVWLNTCRGVEDHPFVFVRHSQRRLDDLKKRYHYIHGVVDAGNPVSVRWLKWLGFRLSCPEFFNGYYLRKFSMAS